MERNNLYYYSDGVFSVDEYWGKTLMYNENNSETLNFLKVKEKGKLYFKIKNSFNTEEKFKEHFADKLYTVESRRFVTVVEKNEHKLSIKIFWTLKRRNKGVFYFTTRKNMYFLTVNLVQGDLYLGHILGYQSKRKVSRSVKRNVFNKQNIGAFVSTISAIIGDNLPSVINKTSTVILQELKDVFVSELERYHDGPFSTSNMSSILYEFYLKKKGIKYPNNFEVFTQEWGILPNKKQLTKSGMKFIDAFMLKNGFKGDVVKKTLHECQHFRGKHLYLGLVELFGTDWLHQTPGVVKACFEKQNTWVLGDQMRGDFENLTKSEKKRCWDFLVNNHLLCEDGSADYIPMTLIRDHVEFISFLRGEGVEVSWKSKGVEDLATEHYQLSQLVSDYRKGDFKRIYPEGYYEVFTQPIVVDKQFYVTKILDTTENYNEESSFQNNCVRTYMKKASSFIVSVRKGLERATVEYVVTKKSKKDEFEVTREQYLGRFNKGLDESWKDILEKVDERFKFVISEWGYDIFLEKKTKVGHVMKSDIEYTDLGYAKWSNPKIFDTSHNSFFLDNF